jgi:phage baseplate assembly protein W
MAIKIRSLEPKKNTGTLTQGESTYRDLALDFSMESIGSAKKLFASNVQKDLDTNTDFSAIDNSIYNIFNTAPGQKILNPAFGADLKRYLFQPVSEPTAKILGEVIVKALLLYEPRVKVKNVDIKAFPDDNMYKINIFCDIKSLANKQYKFTGSLTTQGLLNTTTSSY